MKRLVLLCSALLMTVVMVVGCDSRKADQVPISTMRLTHMSEVDITSIRVFNSGQKYAIYLATIKSVQIQDVRIFKEASK